MEFLLFIYISKIQLELYTADKEDKIMRNHFLLCIFTFFGCTLFEPSYLVIQNNSDYTIKVYIDNANKKEIIIDKNNGDYVLTFSNKINLIVIIDSIGFKKKYSISINYLEKKKFIFNLK